MLLFPTFLWIFVGISASEPTENDLELEFVQALWRHGDRAALFELYPVGEQNWTLGGGGLGELTPIGMAQLNGLGGMLRRRYVTDREFLRSRYASREVHIRSTNVNRTIISAMALAYGLFPPGPWNVQGEDYPGSGDWQQGLTFVPIHVDGNDQCAIQQKCKCSRVEELKKKWAELPEAQTATARMIEMNRRVAAYYNITKDVDEFNEYPDTWKCQRNWFNESMYQKLPWYNEELYEEAQRVFAPLKQFTEGQFAQSSQIDGIDVAEETKTLITGPLLNELYNRAQEKLQCSQDRENCSSFLKPLKFYGYSAHDLMIHGLLVILGIPELVESIDGWPDYASSLIFESYSNPQTDDTYFKVFYRDNADSELSDVTEKIPICNGARFCSMQNLRDLAEFYRPKPDFETLCKKPLSDENGSPLSIDFRLWISIFTFILLIIDY